MQASAGKTWSVTTQTAGGELEVAIKLLDGAAGIVDQVLVTGDFFVAPPRIIADLEAHLRHLPVEALAARAEMFLRKGNARFLGLAAEEISQALARAANAPEVV